MGNSIFSSEISSNNRSSLVDTTNRDIKKAREQSINLSSQQQQVPPAPPTSNIIFNRI